MELALLQINTNQCSISKVYVFILWKENGHNRKQNVEVLHQPRDVKYSFWSCTVVIQCSDYRCKQVIFKSLQFHFENNPLILNHRCDNAEYLLSAICHSLLIGRWRSGGEPWNCHLSRRPGAWLCWYDLCRCWLCHLLCKLIVSLFSCKPGPCRGSLRKIK